MEEHEEYPRSLMSMESYDPEAHDLPSMRIFETVEHSHTHGVCYPRFLGVNRRSCLESHRS
jgi:hypothetical protein